MNTNTNARAKHTSSEPPQPKANPPEGHEHDAPQGPVHRGGSLLPHDQEPEDQIDESSDESFPASDAPSWSPTSD